MIVTTWLLTGETTNQSNWLSTRIGKDIFTRTMPTDDFVLDNKKKGISNSFPVGIE
jgi:hypothetical protein